MSATESMALQGIRVLDFSRFLPAPFCAMMLADFGADVIRIEQPGEVAKQAKIFGRERLSPAEMRRLKRREQVSRNKRSLLLNLRDETARAAARRMLADCDVVIHDYRPGVMESMGLGYQDATALNAGLVYCAVSLCGQTGPRREAPGHDPIALALAGALGRFGDEGTPAIPGLPVGDMSTGFQAVIGILLALRARDQSGEGQLVDVAMSDCALGLMTSVMQRYLVDGREPPLQWSGGNMGLWQAADGGYVCTTDLEPAYWEKFCRAVQRPELIPLQFDAQQQDYLQCELGALFLSRNRDEWCALLAEAGTQVAPAYTLDEALGDEHARARGTVNEYPDEDGVPVTQIGPAIKLSKTPGAVRRLAPMPGEDSVAILEEFGFSSEEIGSLLADR
ncbi:CaiB/BaiF CoA transferase family protein [Gilvimarinus sp. F26214L]|uniref:CaiB/BaiF CoA transferase family protein n=1 Tax=Gilvimarinus sp. DZF01 TaxID=3461371 RepID=UPI004045AC04